MDAISHSVLQGQEGKVACEGFHRQAFLFFKQRCKGEPEKGFVLFTSLRSDSDKICDNAFRVCHGRIEN